MRTVISMAVLASAAVLAGCAAALAPTPNYLAAPDPASGASKMAVYVVPFEDARPNTEGTTYFGTIRGGYGNPLERMHFDKPAGNVVQSTVCGVLRANGYTAHVLADSTTSSASQSGSSSKERADVQGPVIAGRIVRLEAYNRPWVLPAGERLVDYSVEVCMVDPRINKNLWCEMLRGQDSDKKASGVSGNTAVMGPWLVRALEDQLQVTLSDKNVLDAWTEHLNRK